MNRLAAVFIATTLLLVGAALYLALELAKARERLAKLDSAESPISAPPAAVPAPRIGAAHAEMPVEKAAASTPAPDHDVEIDERSAFRSVESYERPGVDSRITRRILRAGMRADFKQTYRDFVITQDFTPEEAATFHDLMVQFEHLSGPEGAAGPETSDPVLMNLEQLLGESRMLDFKAFMSSRPSVMQLKDLRRTLDGEDMPLSDDQYRRLVRALVKDRREYPSAVEVAGRDADEARARQDNFDSHWQRFAGEARTVLSAKQFAMFEDMEQVRRDHEVVLAQP